MMNEKTVHQLQTAISDLQIAFDMKTHVNAIITEETQQFLIDLLKKELSKAQVCVFCNNIYNAIHVNTEYNRFFDFNKTNADGDFWDKLNGTAFIYDLRDFYGLVFNHEDLKKEGYCGYMFNITHCPNCGRNLKE